MNFFITEIRETKEVSQEFKDRLENLNLVLEDIQHIQFLLSEDTLFEAELTTLALENLLPPPIPGNKSELNN